jgi:cytochrome c peroxidase
MMSRLYPLVMVALLAGCGESPTTVSQKNKTFDPAAVQLKVDEPLRLLNDDDRTHNIRVHDPAFEYDSGAQEPGETVELRFPASGRYYVVCGIHRKMKLQVDVRR